MRICFLIHLFFCTNGFAQAQLSDWQNVMNLPINTDASIKTKQKTYQGLINEFGSILLKSKYLYKNSSYAAALDLVMTIRGKGTGLGICTSVGAL
jgi:hypothetical protein